MNRIKILQTINFLSIKLIISDEGIIRTDVFYKDTNAHDYLPFDSHHPLHIKKNIPYVLAKRIIVSTSEDKWVDRNLIDLKQWLIEQKYPSDVIDKGIHNAMLQGPAPKPSCEKIIPLITPYVENFDNANIIDVTKDLIGNSKNTRIKAAFSDTKFIQSYKQPPNLLRLLTNSTFISQRRQKMVGIFHCRNKLCKICRLYLQKCSSFTTSSKKEWKVKCYANCGSRNVIYFQVCAFCNR